MSDVLSDVLNDRLLDMLDHDWLWLNPPPTTDATLRELRRSGMIHLRHDLGEWCLTGRGVEAAQALRRRTA